MEGVITVQDTRETLDAMREFQKNEVVTKANQVGPGGMIDGITDTIKTAVSVAGSVLSMIACFVPGGKIATAATIAAQPAILGAIEAGKNLLKGIFVNQDQEQIRASMSDLAGNVQNISIRDVNLAKTVAKKREAFEPMMMEGSTIERKART